MAAKSRVIEYMDLLVEQTSADDHQTMRLIEQGITDCMFAQDELFGFMSNDQQSVTRKSSTVVKLDMCWLMHQITEVSTFWTQHKQQYPRLYKLYRKHHSVLATSAAIEQLL